MLDLSVWNLSDVHMGDFDQPFTDAAQLATFIDHPENDQGEFRNLRSHVWAIKQGYATAISEDRWRGTFMLITRFDPELAYVCRSVNMLRDALLLLSARP